MTITVVMLGKFVCTFLYGKVKDIFCGDKAQISSGEGKRKGYEGVWGEAQNKGYFCKIHFVLKHN